MNVNETDDTYVAWNWDANTSGSNDASSTGIGTIDSTYRVNTSAGFSIVSFTGNDTSGATIAHGLNAIPQLIIVKNRGAAESWPVYHVDVGNGNRMYLNVSNAASAGSNWNNTTPTSNVFTVGDNADTNGDGANLIAYVWSEVAGYSRFGEYEGNGSADGTFTYCGFKPGLVIIKHKTATQSWMMYDTARSPCNLIEKLLNADNANAEAAWADIDIVSNGLKVRDTHASINTDGSTYIFMAWAESSFKYANAR